MKPKAIIATSWNGTPLMYNNHTDQWDQSDEVILGPQHYAEQKDMEDALTAADRDRVLLSSDPELCEVED